LHTEEEVIVALGLDADAELAADFLHLVHELRD
jgi:hypothetical protein